MKRKIISVTLIMAMLLAGCSKSSGQSSNKNSKETVSVVEQGRENDEITLSEISAKYATVTTGKVVEPLYNVAPDETFEIDFAYDLSKGGFGAENIASVHTDINCEKDSMIYTYVSYTQAEDGGSVLKLSPIRAILENTGNKNDYFNNKHAVWGNAPIFYIAVWYDMESATLTKLEKPIVIPFTIKHEVEAPEVRGVVDNEGCFSLEWDAVKGATEYRIYAYKTSKESTGKSNAPIDGAKHGFGNGSLIKLGTVEGDKTSFQNFAGSGGNRIKFERNVSGKMYIIGQNTCVNGDYYVSAVVNGVESGFACVVKTADLKLPYLLTDESDLMFKRFSDVADLPKTVDVINIDGSITKRNVMYTFQRENTYLEGVTTPEYVYKVEGTAITGCVSMGDAPKDYKFPEKIGEITLTGNTEAKDDIKSQPEKDVVSIPDKNTDDKNVIKQQIEKTEEAIKNNKDVSISKPEKGMPVFAESAAEEWLALNLINGKTEFSVEAFPELQTKEVLVDTLLKAYHQNPYVLGLYRYGYNYKTKMVKIEYVYSDDERIKRQEEISKAVREISAELIKDNMSEDDKQLAIYNYLESNTQYDKKALETATQNNFKKQKDSQHEDSFNAYGILVKKVGVCQSYANAYKLLCTQAGLKCDVATGFLSGNLPHAWNYVKVNDKWYQTDITNNGKSTGVPFYLYNADSATAEYSGYTSDAQFELDSNLKEYVTNSDDYEYYHKEKLCATTVAQYKEILGREIKTDKELIIIRYEGKMLTKAEVKKAISETYNMNGKESELSKIKYGTFNNFVLVKR